MTSKEKIENAWELVNSKHIETNDEIQLVRFAVRMARELVERDTPMKPIVDKLDLWDEHKCPVCEGIVWETHVHKDKNFCNSCGQRLDWSDL